MRLLPALLGLLLAAPAALSLGPTALWPDGPGHDHANPAHHEGVGAGLEQLAQVKIRDGSVGSVDVQGNLAVVAHFGSSGLTTVDISDPANPRRLGALQLNMGAGTDVKLLPGGKQAILSTQGGGCRLPLAPVSLPKPTGCGVNLVDLTDPAQPKVVAGLPIGERGVHMLDIALVAGQPFAFVVAQGGTYFVGVLAVQANAMALVGAITTDTPESYVHDVTVRPDPLTGRTLAYLAAWGQGVWIYDVTVPSLPLPLASWDSDDAPNIHTVMVAYVEGRRIVVAAPEYRNSVHVLDATDLLNIHRIGQWRFPDNKPEGSLSWSTHDFNVRDNRVYQGHYHGGVVVWGLRTLAEAQNPPLLAYRLPTGAKYTGGNAPMTWDAVPADNGMVLAGDMTMGLVVMRET